MKIYEFNTLIKIDHNGNIGEIEILGSGNEELEKILYLLEQSINTRKQMLVYHLGLSNLAGAPEQTERIVLRLSGDA